MKQFSTWDANYYIYMDCFYLTEESRDLGVGQKLIESIQKECRESGIILIQWQTPDFNNRAMKFYNKLGQRENLSRDIFSTLNKSQHTSMYKRSMSPIRSPRYELFF